MIEEKLRGFKVRVNLIRLDDHMDMPVFFSNFASVFKKMIVRLHSFRYYWYYGPLSAGRDGRAMSCRETID